MPQSSRTMVPKALATATSRTDDHIVRTARNAFVGLGGLRQWVRLDDRFDFPLRHEIKSLVEIFGAVPLAADDADALHDEIHQRDGKWLRVRAHSDQPAVWPQSLNAVHHGLRRIGSAEDDVGTTRCGKALAVADNF